MDEEIYELLKFSRQHPSLTKNDVIKINEPKYLNKIVMIISIILLIVPVVASYFLDVEASILLCIMSFSMSFITIYYENKKKRYLMILNVDVIKIDGYPDLEWKEVLKVNVILRNSRGGQGALDEKWIKFYTKSGYQIFPLVHMNYNEKELKSIILTFWENSKNPIL